MYYVQLEGHKNQDLFQEARSYIRDRELLANIQLVEQKLDHGSAEGEPFLDAVRRLRDSMTWTELLMLGVALQFAAAVSLLFAGKTGRWIGAALLVPAVLVSLELCWWGPVRPGRAIVLAQHTEVVAEPRDGMDAVLKLRAGVTVEVLGEGPTWSRVRVGERDGYVRSEVLGHVR